MKSFNQFLQESYLSEEESRQGSLFTRSGKPQNFRNPKKVPFTATDPTPIPASKRLSAVSSPTATQSPGQLEIPEPKTTRVSGSQFRNAGEARQGLLFTRSGKPQKFKKGTPFVATEPIPSVKRLPSAPPESPKPSPGQQEIRQLSNPPTTRALPPGKPGGELAKTINAIPDSMARGAYDAARSRKPSSGRPSTVISPSIEKPSSPGKPPSGVKPSRLGKLAGPALNVAGAAMDYKERREAGQSIPQAAGGAVSSLAGWTAGARLGAKIPGPPLVKGAAALAGGLLGAEKAQQAYDWALKNSRPARQAISKATGFDEFQRKSALIKPGSGLSGIERAQQTVDTRGARQVSSRAGTYGARKGSAVTGIGGPTYTSKDSKGKAFISTGVGSQRRSVQLPSTQLIRDPKTGKQTVGDLAFKGGKATYLVRPSIASRDTGLSSVFRNISRSTGIGGQKQRDLEASRREYKSALKNTQRYQEFLGITPQAAKAKRLPGR